MSPALDNAVEKAKDESMPEDNIERAIQRGGGGAEGEQYESVAYEGCGSTPRAPQKDAADTFVLSRVGGMGQRPGHPPLPDDHLAPAGGGCGLRPRPATPAPNPMGGHP